MLYSLARGNFSYGGNPVPIIKYKIHISNWKKEVIERWKIIKKMLRLANKLQFRFRQSELTKRGKRYVATITIYKYIF